MHLMIIPDGEIRYSKKYNVPLEKVCGQVVLQSYNLIKQCLLDHDIHEYTLLAISCDDIKNLSKEEIEPIFRAQASAFLDVVNDSFFSENGVRIKVHGSKELLPDYYLKAIEVAENTTKQNKKKILNILVAYSEELDTIEAIEKTTHSKMKLTSENILKNSMISTPVDFLIRTAGEKRVSDSPLFALQFTEFYFIDKFFLELTGKDIDEALEEYKHRNRTFGK